MPKLWLYLLIAWAPLIQAAEIATEVFVPVDFFSKYQQFKEHQKKIDTDFKAGNFSKALTGYRKLAEINDKYSQYKLAYMYLNGLAAEVNLREAFAWAVIAAESGQPEYRRFYEDIKTQINTDDLASHYQLARSYLKQYGNLPMLLHIKVLIDKTSLCDANQDLQNCEYYRPEFQANLSQVLSDSEIRFDQSKVDEYILLYSKPFFEYSEIDDP